MSRHQDEGITTGLQEPMESADGDFWCVEMLENVDADDGVQTLVLELDVEIRILKVADRGGEVLEVPVPLFESADERNIAVDRDQTLAIEQERGHVAGTAASLQYTVPDGTVELLERPSRDLWRGREVAQAQPSRILREPGIHEPELEQQPHRLETITPADRLALRVCPTVVGDWDLVDPRPRLREPSRDLGLDAEAFAPEPEILEQVCSDGLVARLHVGQVQVVEDVREPCEESVPQRVPVEQ